MQAFDGLANDVELPIVDPSTSRPPYLLPPAAGDLPYGDRVIGIGDFKFAPTPRPASSESTMASLCEDHNDWLVAVSSSNASI